MKAGINTPLYVMAIFNIPGRELCFKLVKMEMN